MERPIENLSIIAAMTYGRIIGKDGKLPWHIPGEMKLFKDITKGKTLIMGRATYDSIGHPLDGRNTIVISRSMPKTEGLIIAGSLEEALEAASELGKPIFSAGGGSVYRQTLPLARQLYISYIKQDYDGDTFFPEFNKLDYSLEEYRDYPDFKFMRYLKRK